ncbi:hypothetical protein [Erwinia phage vB_Ea_2910A]|nr:hypothetical protein [Erwinia phage vB_Ea_2910A]
MNTISGSVIDEDVLEWLDGFTSHDQRKIADTINAIAYAHRTELSIPNMLHDEDIAALSHADLFTLLSLAAPNAKYDLTLSNVQLLGLAMNACGIIQYSLPELNSPIMIKRTFADERRKNMLGGDSSRGDVIKALNQWICGLRNIDLTHAGTDYAPDISGMYLCLDEHEQVRYGRLFPNSADGMTFVESYEGSESTMWFSDSTGNRDDDDLPMTLLSHWVLVAEWHSPNVKAAQKAIPLSGVSDTHRIFMFLRSLSPHVKAELVAHFKGVLDHKEPTSVDGIGRLTEHDWRTAAVAVADDAKMPEGVKSWSEVNAWVCFVAVAEALGFNFETRQFDPQFDYQANDDALDEDE